VNDSESTIPAPRRVMSNPSFKNTEEKPTATLDDDPVRAEIRAEFAKLHNKPVPPKGWESMSDAEFEARKEMLKRQGAEVLLRLRDTSVSTPLERESVEEAIA
jgi:hypothetical protein